MALTVVLCDEDERYLVPLELKIAEEFGDKVELIAITEKEYLKFYFSTPQDIDVLIINEALYEEEYEKHNINNVFLLTEEDEAMNTEDISLKKIYKYTSIKQIFNDIISNMSSKTIKNISSKEKDETQFIMVYSPSGGTGNTVVSMGIAAALSKCNKKVLFISTESIQSFNYYLKNKAYLSNDFARELQSHGENLLGSLRKSVNKEIFDYLLPFEKSTNSYNVTLDNYIYLLDALRYSEDYDFVVLDTSSQFSNNKTKLMSLCHKVIMVSMQSEDAAVKLSRMMDNIDCSDRNKFIFICNKYNENKVNYLIKNPDINNIAISEYIPYFNEEIISMEALANNKHFKKLAYTII